MNGPHLEAPRAGAPPAPADAAGSAGSAAATTSPPPAATASPPAASPNAVDRLFGLYALASGVALFFPNRPAAWPLLAALHFMAALYALRIGPVAVASIWLGRAPKAVRILTDWYPLLLVPALYAELAPLNRAVHAGRYFDPWIQVVEHALFGGPSHTLAAAAPNLILSELLHGAYISYYFIIYAPPFLLYLAGRREEFRRVVFALMLAFFVPYLCFIYFPVQGPRYLFPVPVEAAARGPLYALAHSILEAGSSRGAAFPSSHVAVAVVQTVLVARVLPRLFPLIALLTVGLTVGAVYGGFHYATDVTAGLLLGLALAALAPSLRRRLRR